MLLTQDFDISVNNPQATSIPPILQNSEKLEHPPTHYHETQITKKIST